jgi:hypothetical protein
MDNFIEMHFLDTLACLFHEFANICFRNSANFDHMVVEIAFVAELKEKIDILFIIKYGV